MWAFFGEIRMIFSIFGFESHLCVFFLYTFKKNRNPLITQYITSVTGLP